MTPSLSLVVPTKDRPDLLVQAVDSALEQDVGRDDLEVVVVDDGSQEPVDLPADPRVRVLRHARSEGGAAARTTGLMAVRGRWVGWLDDDDTLRADHARRALDVLEGPPPVDPRTGSTLPEPLGVLTGVEVVNAAGQTLEIRRPPTLPCGSVYQLEASQPGRSWHVKQTLVTAPEVVRRAGGWDRTFRSRVHTDLFLRLNPGCSLVGVDAPTYRLRVHPGERVSGDPGKRVESLHRLLDVHADLLAQHPRGTARLLVDHARVARLQGLTREALWAWQEAARRHRPTAARSAAYGAVMETRGLLRRVGW